MSVIRYDTKDFANIATTIINNLQIRENFYTPHEIKMLHHSTTVKDTNFSILCFVERLNIANALAFEYTYSQENQITIERFAEADLKGEELTPTKFNDLLKKINYNLISNSGRIFLGGQDTIRIKQLLKEIV